MPSIKMLTEKNAANTCHSIYKGYCFIITRLDEPINDSAFFAYIYEYPYDNERYSNDSAFLYLWAIKQIDDLKSLKSKQIDDLGWQENTMIIPVTKDKDKKEKKKDKKKK